MSTGAKKIKVAFFPLILLSILFIVVYLLLYWFLYIHLNIIYLKKDIVEYWMPIGIASILIVIFIRPRVHILKIDKNDGKIRTLYYLTGVAILVTPTTIGTNYLESATGKLTKLSALEQISDRSATKYYAVNTYVVSKSNIGIYNTATYSGKNNNYLNYDIHIAMPFESLLLTLRRHLHICV